MWFCPFSLNLDVFEEGVKTIRNNTNGPKKKGNAKGYKLPISVPLVLCFSAGDGHYQTADAEKAPAVAEAPCLAVPLPGSPIHNVQCSLAGLPLPGRAAAQVVSTFLGQRETRALVFIFIYFFFRFYFLKSSRHPTWGSNSLRSRVTRSRD